MDRSQVFLVGPPKSPDLTPLDLFIRDHLNKVYVDRPHVLKDNFSILMNLIFEVKCDYYTQTSLNAMSKCLCATWAVSSCKWTAFEYLGM